MGMDNEMRQEVLELAEHGEWDALIEHIEHDPELAQAQDDFGMLPLHWACTEPSIALDDLKAIIQAYADACRVQNNSGMLPLHVAITSKLPGLHLSALLQVYPEAAFVKNGKGVYPVEAAMENHLPKYSIDVIRRAGARVIRSGSATMLRHSVSLNSIQGLEHQPRPDLSKAHSMGSFSSSSRDPIAFPSSTGDRLSRTSIDVGESALISSQLQELMTQLQQLSVDLRSSTSSMSTYRSSFSSSASSSSSSTKTILWNPSDKLGITFEPVSNNEMGARIKKFGSKSAALGIEALKLGDVLVSINGTSVAGSSYTSIVRFLKHAKVTCQLGFAASSPLESSRASVDSNTAPETEVVYARVSEMLDLTLKKVSEVEESVRLSSAMSFCS